MILFLLISERIVFLSDEIRIKSTDNLFIKQHHKKIKYSTDSTVKQNAAQCNPAK